jgi:hypothetical protein
LLEDADNVVILRARDGQRRRRHRRPSLCPLCRHSAKATEIGLRWGKEGAGRGKCVWMAGSCVHPFAKKLVVGRRSAGSTPVHLTDLMTPNEHTPLRRRNVQTNTEQYVDRGFVNGDWS